MEVGVETEFGMTMSGVRLDKAVREEVGRVRAKGVPVYRSEQMCYPVAINRAARFGAGPLVPKVAQV